MYNFEIVSLFKGKDPTLAELESRYEKRLKPLAKLTHHELVAKGAEKLSPEARTAAEAEFVIGKLKPSSTVIALDEQGVPVNSVAFSELLKQYALQGQSTFTFVVGGAYGLHSSIHERAHKVIALSQLTFTSGMARMILLEQLYRAMSIIAGKPYHKE